MCCKKLQASNLPSILVIDRTIHKKKIEKKERKKNISKQQQHYSIMFSISVVYL